MPGYKPGNFDINKVTNAANICMDLKFSKELLIHREIVGYGWERIDTTNKNKDRVVIYLEKEISDNSKKTIAGIIHKRHPKIRHRFEIIGHLKAQ